VSTFGIGDPRTVLLVEDEDLVRAVARRVLRHAGFRVLEARSALEALDLAARDEPIDLGLVDVVLPGMSGRAFAERVTIERPAMRFLFMSGYCVDEMRASGLLASGAFIGKPFTPRALIARVRELLNS
jgi:two-component system cell cycle sensor histidine kinase/response regulator CckA